MTLLERRKNGHFRLEISPALLGVWAHFQRQTECLQLGYMYIPTLLTASQGLGTASFLSNWILTHNTQYSRPSLI